MHLGECPLDHDVVVVAVDLPQESRLRMWEIGVYADAVVRVTHRGPYGGRVVAVDGARLALDGATATKVQVEDPL